MKLAFDQYTLDARYSPEPRVPEFAMRNDTCMESDSGKRAKESGVRDRRYFIRHPFPTQGEVLGLKSGGGGGGADAEPFRGGGVVCSRCTPGGGAPARGI